MLNNVFDHFRPKVEKNVLLGKASELERNFLDNNAFSEYYYYQIFKKASSDFHDKWKSEFTANYETVLNANSRMAQKLKLRERVLDNFEFLMHNKIYREDLSEEERKVVAAELHSDWTFEEAEGYAAIYVGHTELSLLIMRNIQIDIFNDSRENDYFSFYSEIFPPVVKSFLASKLKPNGFDGMLLPIQDALCRQVKKDALAGKSKIYKPLPKGQ